MRALIQRVKKAWVEIDGKTVGAINEGILLLIGFENNDSKSDIGLMVSKIADLRIFQEGDKHFDKSLRATKGGLLIVSQFTLAGTCEKGRRPDFANAMPPDRAKEFYDDFVSCGKDILGQENVACGVFGADMTVFSANDGPVTFIIDKKSKK